MITEQEAFILFWWRMLSDEQQETFLAQADDYDKYPEYVLMLDSKNITQGDTCLIARKRHPKIAQPQHKASTLAN